MLSLLLGPDDFSKLSYVESLAQNGGQTVFFGDQEIPDPENLSQQDLFSQPKVFVLRNLINNYRKPEIAQKFVTSKNQVVFIEEKLDKRLAENKQLLANKNITVKQFNLPHGRELNDWLANRVKFYRGKIAAEAVEALAAHLGRDNGKETKFGGKVVEAEEVYNLWQADNEVKKLVSFADGGEITATDVKALVSENGEVDAFDLTNAIADNKRQEALELLQKFLSAQAGSDEKGAVIQLNALLAEQFRSVAVVQDFLARNTPEGKILEATGWKSGRLFIMKKVAARFPAKKILELLRKLEALDTELKTSQTPPKVLLDLIVSQLLI